MYWLAGCPVCPVCAASRGHRRWLLIHSHSAPHVAGWLACAAGAVVQSPARGSRGVGIAAGFLWAVTGVGSGRADILVVDVLKHYFHR